MNKDPTQYAISTLQKNSGSFVGTGFVLERPTSIDTGATVSIMCPDVVKYLKPIWCSCSLQTATGRPVKVYGKVEVHLRLGRLEFNHQVLVADRGTMTTGCRESRSETENPPAGAE